MAAVDTGADGWARRRGPCCDPLPRDTGAPRNVPRPGRRHALPGAQGALLHCTLSPVHGRSRDTFLPPVSSATSARLRPVTGAGGDLQARDVQAAEQNGQRAAWV